MLCHVTVDARGRCPAYNRHVITQPEAMSSSVVELNVGGVHYATCTTTITSDCGSLLAEWFSSASPALATDNNGR